MEEKGFFNIIDSLIQSGVNINGTDKFGNTPLWYACIYYATNTNSIKLLLEKGANMDIVNKYGLSVHTAAKQNDRQELISILDEFKK